MNIRFDYVIIAIICLFFVGVFLAITVFSAKLRGLIIFPRNWFPEEIDYATMSGRYKIVFFVCLLLFFAVPIIVFNMEGYIDLSGFVPFELQHEIVSGNFQIIELGQYVITWGISDLITLILWTFVTGRSEEDVGIDRFFRAGGEAFLTVALAIAISFIDQKTNFSSIVLNYAFTPIENTLLNVIRIILLIVVGSVVVVAFLELIQEVASGLVLVCVVLLVSSIVSIFVETDLSLLADDFLVNFNQQMTHVDVLWDGLFVLLIVLIWLLISKVISSIIESYNAY